MLRTGAVVSILYIRFSEKILYFEFSFICLCFQLSKICLTYQHNNYFCSLKKKKCNFFIETLTVLRLLEVIETFTKTWSFQIVWFFGSMDSLAFKFFGVHERKSHKSYVKIYFILKYFCLKFQILMKLSMVSPYHNHFPWRVLVAHQRPLTLLSGSQGVWITSTTRQIILKLLRWASSTFPASCTEF